MKSLKVIIYLVVFLISILVIYVKGCTYMPIEGTVVDAETGKPIEGANILAWWTIRKGKFIGLAGAETYKIVETTTDRDGHFIINAYILSPFKIMLIDEPSVTIYKAGYVAWNNSYIFPEYKPREKFKWKRHGKYLLEQFKTEYSNTDHVSFIESFIPSLDARDLFEKAYEWERMMRQKELGGDK